MISSDLFADFLREKAAATYYAGIEAVDPAVITGNSEHVY